MTTTLRLRPLGTIALAAALGAALLAGCSSPSKPASSSSTGASDNPSAVSTAPIDLGGGASAPVDMGQPTKSGDWGLTVKSLEFATDAGGAKAGPSEELAVLTLALTNNSSSGQGIGPSAFELSGPDGSAYQAAPTSSPDFIFNTAQPIKAAETRAVKIAFQAPAGAKTFKLTFKPFSPTGQAAQATVNVK